MGAEDGRTARRGMAGGRTAFGRKAVQDGYRRTEMGTEDRRTQDACISGLTQSFLTQSFLRSPPDGVPPASPFSRSSFDLRHQRGDLSRQTGSVFSYFLRNVRIEQSYVFGQIKLRPHFTGRTTRYPEEVEEFAITSSFESLRDVRH